MKITQEQVEEFYDDIILKMEKLAPNSRPTISTMRTRYSVDGKIGWMFHLHVSEAECLSMGSFADMHEWVDARLNRREEKEILFRKF
jgi:hypothetical protein